MLLGTPSWQPGQDLYFPLRMNVQQEIFSIAISLIHPSLSLLQRYELSEWSSSHIWRDRPQPAQWTDLLGPRHPGALLADWH